MNGRVKGIVAGAALAVGITTGGFWASLGSTSVAHTDASSCHQIFAGRAGTVSTCRPPDDQVSRNIKRFVGTTITGCVLGIPGGPTAIAYGCAGGAASNIPWAGWPQ